MNQYLRVIPRDLFNEGNFYKCLAALYLKTEGLPETEFFHDPETPFTLAQDESGSLYPTNIEIVLMGKPLNLSRPLNSRAPYPLIDSPDPDTELAVFTDDGELSREFIEYYKIPQHNNR